MQVIKNTSVCIIWKYDEDDKKRWNMKCDYMASAVVRGRKIEINGNSIAWLEKEMERMRKFYGQKHPRPIIC